MSINKEQIYAEIEKEFPRYADVSKIGNASIETDSEPFVEIPQEFNTFVRHDKILVRKQVCEKFLAADKLLQSIDKNLSLRVFEGYRSLEQQKIYFKETLERTNGDIEWAHTQTAHPDVAGHPTGGAIDVIIRDAKGYLDFGTGYSDFSRGETNPPKMHYYASPEVTAEQRRNRELLNAVMTKQGFVYCASEWWHFSYGDKDWAFMTGRDAPLYNQKELKDN